MKLIIMGPQGAGKGTQAETLSKIYQIPTISTGELLRNISNQETAQGKQIKAIIDAGVLVPDNVIISILEERLSHKDCKKGYILDGFPRTLEQAKLIDGKIQIDKVIYLDIELDAVKKRIAGRRTCPKCGHVHNTQFAGDATHCLKCGTEYIIRADDNEEAIEKRLKTFAEKTLPIVKFYDKQKKVLKVDASGTPATVLEQIVKGLGK